MIAGAVQFEPEQGLRSGGKITQRGKYPAYGAIDQPEVPAIEWQLATKALCNTRTSLTEGASARQLCTITAVNPSQENSS